MRRSSVTTSICILSLFSYSYAQWTEPVRIGAPGGVLYPQILAQGETLHVVYSNNYEGWKIGYVKSTDGGNNWSDQQVLSDTVNTTQTRFPKIISHSDTLMTLWLSQFDQSPYNYNVGFSVSSNNGLAWGAPEYVLDHGWTFPFFVAATGVGPIINIEASGAPENTMIFYNIRSTNFGQGWSDPVELFRAAESGTPDAAAGDGFVHYVWAGRLVSEGSWETYYIRSTDEGVNWSEPINMSEIDEYHSYWPSISVNELSEAALSWMDFKYSPYFFSGDILIRGSFDSGGDWFAERQATFHHLAMRSDVVLEMDNIHISWEDGRSENGQGSIYYICSSDSGNTWGDEYRLDQDSSDSRNPAMATSDRRVYAIWADDRCDPDTDICGGIYFSRWDEASEIPTLSEWGILILALILLAMGTVAVVWRRKVALSKAA